MTDVRTILAAAAIFAAVPQIALSQSYGLGPKQVSSPSGRYCIKISAAKDALGDDGPTAYEVLKDGKRVWKKTQPFFLYDAVIGDSGAINGFSYHGGLRGISSRHVFITVWHIDGSGNTTQLKQFQRYPDLDRVTYPVAGHLILQEPQDRVLVTISRIPEGGHSKTHIFRFINSTGGVDGEWDVDHLEHPIGAESLIGTQAIYPTGLALMAWTNKSGDLLVGLYDLNGKQVWTEHFEKGLAWTVSTEQALLLMVTSLGPPMGYPTGAFVRNPISSTGVSSSFILRIKDESVLFDVHKTELGWSVTEKSRSVIPPPKDSVDPKKSGAK